MQWTMPAANITYCHHCGKGIDDRPRLHAIPGPDVTRTVAIAIEYGPNRVVFPYEQLDFVLTGLNGFRKTEEKHQQQEEQR